MSHPATEHTVKAAVHVVMRILRGHFTDPQPEEMLWLAVIERAVRDAYLAPVGTPSREEARDWLGSNGFDAVCYAIGLHPRWARSKIALLDRAEQYTGPLAGTPSPTAAGIVPAV